MDWIELQYKNIEKQKLELENLISEISILFKPWPPKTRSSESESKKDTQSLVENNQDTGEPCLTAEELAGVALVDNLLKKANKAREIQQKLENPKKTKGREVGKSNVHTTKNKEKKSSASNTEVKQDPPFQPDSQESNVSVSGEKHGRKSEVVSGANSTTSNKVSPIDLKKGTDKSGSASGSRTAKSDKSHKTKISDRPKSASVQRKLPAVHSNAPFLTNPRLHTAKLKTTYQAATSKTQAKTRQATKSSARGRHAVSGSSSGERSVSSSSVRSVDIPAKPASVNSVKQCDSDSRSEQPREVESGQRNSVYHNSDSSNDGIAEQVQSSEVLDNTRKELESIKLQNQNDKIEKSTQEEVHQENNQVLFRLEKNGNSLKVPGKLKKLVHQNRKLRQQLYTQKVTQKVDTPPSSGCEFPYQLQHNFGDVESRQVQLQAKQAEYLLNVYTNLVRLLDSLHLENISEESHVADVYRAKVVMEYILTTFQETEQLLHQADFSLLQSASLCPANTDINLPSSVSPNFMLYHQKQQNQVPGPVLKYSSYKQLQDFVDVMFDTQKLQLQIEVMEHLSDTVFPLLHTLDPQGSDFVQALRIAYSLLSQNRNRMPVVIKDTIEPLPEDEQW